MEMVRRLMCGSDYERNKKIKNLEQGLEKKNQRLQKLQDLYLDGGLSQEDYASMRNRYNTENQ
jgi:hypothetical protein